MKTLDELAILHQTDRASVFTRTYGKPHDYARHYDKVFSPLRDQPVKLLEIGVGGGEGVKMWLEYFYNSQTKVFGVDNQSNTNPWDSTQNSESHRYWFCPGDQSDSSFWSRFKEKHGVDFDIIIDDGSHINTDIITTFLSLWGAVKPGGFYAIEDLSTSYGVGSMFVNPNLPSQMEFLKGKLDELNKGTAGIDSVYWARELCIIRKALA